MPCATQSSPRRGDVSVAGDVTVRVARLRDKVVMMEGLTQEEAMSRLKVVG